jgi:hypothetical protein
MMRWWSIFVFSLLSTALPAQSPPPPSTPQSDDVETDIVVEGLSKAKHMSLAQFRSAQQAFMQFRGSMAPTSRLTFKLVGSSKAGITDAVLSTIHLAFVSKENRIPITVGADHRFTLPDISTVQGDYRLLANIGKRKIFIVPEVYSNGTSEKDRRVGDLRLTCQTLWGFYKSEVPIFMRAGFSLVGGCSSKSIGFMEDLHRPLESATVEDAGKATPIAISPKFASSYRWPIWNKKLSNEARVRIKFK